jgi:NADPH:quinone reductase
VLSARVHEFGSEPVLEEVAELQPVAGESLVAIEAATATHLDLTVLTGSFVARPPLPYVPGTDGAGVVLESAVHASGTRVRIRGGGIGIGRDGTWAQRASVPDDALHPVEDDVDAALAAAFFSPATTAHVALHELGALAHGERVAVTGATGAVGSLVVQLALHHGAADVQALVGRAAKLDAVAPGARALGPAELPDEVDLLVDTVGGARLAELIPRVRPGGRAVLVGYTAGVDVTFQLPLLLASAVRLLPLSMLEWGPRIAHLAPDLLLLLQTGELRLPIDRRPLSELTSALADLRAGRVVGRLVLLP